MKRYTALLLCIVLAFQSLSASASNMPFSEKTDLSATSAVTDEAVYAQNRIIVKLKADFGVAAAFSAHTAEVDPFAEFKELAEEMYVINPSADGGTAAPANLCEAVENTQDNMLVVTLKETGSTAVEEALELFGRSPAVEYAVPDTVMRLCDTSPNDELYISTAYEALDCIKIKEAWKLTTGSDTVTVAVVDSGIDITHEDLKDNIWVNPNPGESGYTDDYYGYDFRNGHGGALTDTLGHGTHVAGIIGARGNNGIGVCGVNMNVKLASLAVADEYGNIYLSDAVQAINYAKNNGIEIINASWGSYAAFNNFNDFKPLYEAIENYNGLFVAAAGNDGVCNDTYPFYPASFDLPNIISVAASYSSGVLPDLSNTARVGYSNYGLITVDIAAPGDNILSTVPGNGYEAKSGTSMAAPMVAGVAALVKAKYPELSAREIKSAILNGAVKNTQFLVTCISNGAALNAYGALIEEKAAATGLKIGPVGDSFTVETGQTMRLYANVLPGEAEQEVIWSSGNTEVVRISDNGQYTAVAPGKAVITATSAENAELRHSVTVTVTEAVSPVAEFTDENFKTAYINKINSSTADLQSGIRCKESLIYLSETENETFLELIGSNVGSLEDLKLFPNLENLNILGNSLPESLDLTFLTELKYLSVSATVRNILRTYHYEKGAYNYALRHIKALINGKAVELNLSGSAFMEAALDGTTVNSKSHIQVFYEQTNKPVCAMLNGEELFANKSYVSYYSFYCDRPTDIQITVQKGILITEPSVFRGIAEKLRELYPAAYGYYGWNAGYESTEEEIREYYLNKSLCEFDLERLGIKNAFITTSRYEKANKRIYKIPIGTTVSQLLEGLDNSDGVKAYRGGRAMGENEKIGTGITLKLEAADITLEALTAVVTGDVNGDGGLTVTDMLAIKAAVLKKNALSDVYEIAADTNGDGIVSVTDFIQVKAAILGKGKINAR